MHNHAIWWTGLLLGLMGIIRGGPVPAGVPSSEADRGKEPGHEVNLEPLKPQWNVGDRWIVETSTLRIQVADKQRSPSRGRPVRWQFTVRGIEKRGEGECFRVEICPLLPGRAQPVTTLWVDRGSLGLRQFQTQLPVAGGFRTVTESYRPAGGQPSPVLGPLTILPVDMPVFLSGAEKGSTTFLYETIVGPAGEKAVGDVSFTMEVQQSVSRPKPEQIKGLWDDAFAKDLQARPVVEVQLKCFDRRIRQFWEPGRPWPTLIDNGTTQARLVKVIPAQPHDQPRVER